MTAPELANSALQIRRSVKCWNQQQSCSTDVLNLLLDYTDVIKLGMPCCMQRSNAKCSPDQSDIALQLIFTPRTAASEPIAPGQLLLTLLHTKCLINIRYAELFPLIDLPCSFELQLAITACTHASSLSTHKVPGRWAFAGAFSRSYRMESEHPDWAHSCG